MPGYEKVTSSNRTASEICFGNDRGRCGSTTRRSRSRNSKKWRRKSEFEYSAPALDSAVPVTDWACVNAW